MYRLEANLETTKEKRIPSTDEQTLDRLSLQVSDRGFDLAVVKKQYRYYMTELQKAEDNRA